MIRFSWCCTCCPSHSLHSACLLPVPFLPSSATQVPGCPLLFSSASLPEQRRLSAGHHTHPSGSDLPSPSPEGTNINVLKFSLTGPAPSISSEGLSLKTWDQLPAPPLQPDTPYWLVLLDVNHHNLQDPLYTLCDVISFLTAAPDSNNAPLDQDGFRQELLGAPWQ